MFRFISRLIKAVLVTLFVLGATMAVLPVQVQAAAHVPSVEILDVPANTGCTGGNILVPVEYNIPEPTRVVGSLWVEGVGEVLAYDQPDIQRVETDTYNFINAVFNVANGTRITVQIETYYEQPSNERSYVSLLVYECGTGTLLDITNTIDPDLVEEESVVEESVPGCDVTIAIPNTAVGATITADTPVYWTPGEAAIETFPAGLNVRALGVDASGAYTKVLYVCGFYWVPTNVIGPNYDEVWNGAPLPTGVVN